MPTTSTWALEYSSPALLLKEQESRSAADGDSPASTASTGTKPKVLASKRKRNEEGHDTDGKLEELLQQCTRVSREGIEKVKSLSRARAAAEKAPPASQGEEDLKRVDKIVNALLEECTAKRREYDCDYASNKRGGKAGLELLAASVEETKQTTHGAPTTAFVNSQTSPMQTSEWRAERDAKLAALATENRDFIMLQLNGKRYKALYDPGAQVSLVGPHIAKKLAKHLKGRATSISTPCAPSLVSTLGHIEVRINIDGQWEKVIWKAMGYLDHDVILGADFKKLWSIDTQDEENNWRARKGTWFCSKGKEDEIGVVAECAGLANATFSEQVQLNNLLDRMFAEPESDTFEVCAGLSELSEEQEAAVRVVVERWLTAEPGALGLTRLSEHHIDVQGASPIKHKMRRMTPAMLQVTHDEIAKMLAQGVIEPSASAWSSAPVIVKKADGSNRFCIDYRDLNKVTKKDAYPVQNIDGILDKLRSAKYISTIDLKSAYFQIAMEESSKQYTAFAVPGAGLFQFTRLAYGLTNAPMAFQRLIDAVFGPECEPFVFGYLDDIVIVTRDFPGAPALARGASSTWATCWTVLSYPAPHDIKSLRRFLGMVGWYSRFIPSDAELKLPLLRLTRKSVEWAWTEEQQNAFEALKQALTQAPVLARPDFTKPFIVQTDASAYAIGGVLTQVFDDGEHPIVYVSRVLAAAERNYTTSEKECLALIWTIRKLRPYLEGYRFIAVTDHSALQYLKNLKDPTGRLARWALEMQQWDFEVVHRRGRVHELPDALSRAYEYSEALGEAKIAGVAEVDEEHAKLIVDVEANPGRVEGLASGKRTTLSISLRRAPRSDHQLRRRVEARRAQAAARTSDVRCTRHHQLGVTWASKKLSTE
ncbi:unnamed protein product [Trichogramma brassicae]|uniref:Reverse transcriptase domain-containing protein n=1 Tax=Trichogramma brassicae TaxID=86971 RepID=A0A6H5I3M2_9HYME|nr:unnamed protein product [Trichogramma brassicae]